MNELIIPTSSQQASYDYFSVLFDIILLSTAVLSTFISLLIPCLFYMKKLCQQHPTVLIANISLLESIANFNIILMAVDIFAYENYLDITDIFHTLTFNLIRLPSNQNSDLCVYNYCIYMLVELLSISFHICYAVDLLITIKFPFFTGKKRRKYYYLFSLLLPLATLANSFYQADSICENELAKESIYKVPLWFLFTLLLFCGVSIIIIIISFLQKNSKSKIRTDYIHHHRIILSLLVLLWATPIWTNILIRLDQTDSSMFDVLNKVSFFCIIASTGIINIVRMKFDKFLRQKIADMICFRTKKSEIDGTISQENYIELQKKEKVNEQIWNLPLSGAMNEFQSQQIVHNIIQVVCQACAAHRIKNTTLRQSNLRMSNLTVQRQSTLLYESVYRNTILIQSETQTQADQALFKLFGKKQAPKYQKMNPHDGSIQDLKQLCKKKRKFNMVCVNSVQIQSEDSHLAQKTVHIKNNLKQQHFGEEEFSLLLNIKVTSYSHRIFETLREYDNLTVQSLIQTLDLQKNIQSIKKAKESLGASGSFFFFSFDHKIVIKTIAEQQKDRFIELLPYYFDHTRQNPNSLLARTYGIFSIEIAGISKIYFIMMQNTFQELEEANIKYNIYDMKGSTVQRYVKDQNATVLKDINYFKSADCFIYMSKENKIRLVDEITKDINMLKKHNIMDYSLLLGVGKSKTLVRKADIYSKKGIHERRIDNFRCISELQEITRRVYSISLIDYLQEFNFNKKMELWLKKIFMGGGDISSVGTQIYYQRFLKFLNRVVLVFNVKFQHKDPNFRLAQTI